MSVLSRLRELEAAATPGPWEEDDGNIFSKPLSDERSRIILARLKGDKTLEHPDRQGGGAPLGFVCTTHQEQPNFINDAEFIPAARNALPALLAVVEAAKALLRGLEQDEQDGGIIRSWPQVEMLTAALGALDERGQP